MAHRLKPSCPLPSNTKAYRKSSSCPKIVSRPFIRSVLHVREIVQTGSPCTCRKLQREGTEPTRWGDILKVAVICCLQSILPQIPTGLDQSIRDDIQVNVSSCGPEDLFLTNPKSNPSLHFCPVKPNIWLSLRQDKKLCGASVFSVHWDLSTRAPAISEQTIRTLYH